MTEEWTSAGVGRRILFGAAAAYWLFVAGSAASMILAGESDVGIGYAIGVLSAPLLIALVVRAIYVFVAKPPSGIVSWWVLVIGAVLSLVAAVGRVGSPGA